MTDEKMGQIREELLEVFSKNKCTVADAKLILQLLTFDIESNATVQVGGYFYD